MTFIPGVTVTERILENLRDTIRTITTENGYPFTFREFFDIQFNAWFTTRPPAVGVTLVDDQPMTYGNIARETRRMNAQIDFWLREKVGGELKNEVEQAIWAIYQAVKVDLTRGGVAVDTKLGRVIRAEPEDKKREAGGTLWLDIDYRIMEGNPVQNG